jgi:hypothetical protein
VACDVLLETTVGSHGESSLKSKCDCEVRQTPLVAMV